MQPRTWRAALTLGDFDNDGTIDLSPNNQVTWAIRYQGADGRFGAQVRSALPRPEVVGDFNGDGLTDGAFRTSYALRDAAFGVMFGVPVNR